MAEETYDVKPVGVLYRCDACKLGEMERNGALKFSGFMEDRQTVFPHKCNNPTCGHTQDFAIAYPTIVHRRESRKIPMTEIKKAFLSAPESQLDPSLLPTIEKWDDEPKSIQVLETLDMAIHNGGASDFTVSILQTYYDTLLKAEHKTHEDNVPLATWRTKT